VGPLVRKGGVLPKITKAGPTRLFTRPDVPEVDTIPLVGGRSLSGPFPRFDRKRAGKSPWPP
jgi:hypothetical protein